MSLSKHTIRLSQILGETIPAIPLLVAVETIERVAPNPNYRTEEVSTSSSLKIPNGYGRTLVYTTSGILHVWETWEEVEKLLEDCYSPGSKA